MTNPKHLLIQADLQKPEYEGMTRDEFKAARNAKAIVQWVLIDKQIANNFILGRGLRLKMDRCVASPANPAIDTLIPEAGDISIREAAKEGLAFLATDTGKQIDGQNPKTLGMVALLVAGGVWLQDDSDDFFSLFQTRHSGAELDYGSDVDDLDWEIVQLLPKAALIQAEIEEEEARIAASQARLGTLIMAKAELDAGRDVDGVD